MNACKAWCGSVLVAAAAIAQAAEPKPAAVSHEHGYGQKLGSVRFPTSCGKAAQERLDEGLALLHHMTYEDAGRAFASAARAQPDCAMAYWGEAMTYIHPLWSDPPTAENFAKGTQLVSQARQRGQKTARENAYIAAVEAYYAVGRPAPESKNLVAFDQGWQRVTQQHPDDPEAALFHVLSQVATADPNDKTFARQAKAGERAEAILARLPDHPGAHHYVIHAYDYPPLAQRALPVARKYAGVAPEVPHALHMPTHIYTRLGLWEDSIKENSRAAKAGLAHAEPGQVSNHYLHALDYLAYAYLQRAEDGKADAVLAQIKPLKGPYTIQPGLCVHARFRAGAHCARAAAMGGRRASRAAQAFRLSMGHGAGNRSDHLLRTRAGICAQRRCRGGARGADEDGVAARRSRQVLAVLVQAGGDPAPVGSRLAHVRAG